MRKKETNFIQSFLMRTNQQMNFLILDGKDTALAYGFFKRTRAVYVNLIFMSIIVLIGLLSPPQYAWAALPYSVINLGITLLSVYLVLTTPTEKQLHKHPLTNDDVNDQDIERLHRAVQWQQNPQTLHVLETFFKIANAAVLAGICGYILTTIPTPTTKSGWENLITYFPLNTVLQAFLFQMYTMILMTSVIPVYLNNRCAYFAAKVNRLCNPLKKESDHDDKPSL